MPHLDAPAPPTPPRAPETFSERQAPWSKGLIVDPIPIQKQLMRMLAAIIALVIIAQLMLWGLALLNHRWTQSGPKSGAARWAASQVFAGEKVGGAAGLTLPAKPASAARPHVELESKKGAAVGDRTHFWRKSLGTVSSIGLRKIQQVKKH